MLQRCSQIFYKLILENYYSSKNLSKSIWAISNFKSNHEQLIKGDLLFALCLARLLENKEEAFNDYFGSKYLDAWRMSYTKQLGTEATFEDISRFAQSYSTEQLDGLQKPVKGKLFEILENAHENNANSTIAFPDCFSNRNV